LITNGFMSALPALTVSPAAPLRKSL
jgi:hypothetical protein